MDAVADVLGEAWSRAILRQAAPRPEVVLVAGLIGLALAWTGAWRRTRHLVTIAHEGAHGLVAVLSGRRLGGIRLHRDTSGLTTSRGRGTGAGVVATLAAGYPGPALAGLAGAWAVAEGWAAATLWATVLLLALLLLHVRNVFGLLSVVVAGAVVAAVSWWAPPELLAGFALVVVWFLLLAAPRPVLEMAAQRRRGATGGATGSDADQLGRLTRVPAGVWTAAFWLVTVGALVAGAALLAGGAGWMVG